MTLPSQKPHEVRDSESLSLVSRNQAAAPLPCIWDLRHGDYDDNRTSPYQGGFRGVVLSGLFEFNALKALILFLALIVAPALLTGVALAVIITYGRWVFYAKEMVGAAPVLGLALLALLIGVALWVGRRVVRVGIDNFKHLHYTLVFPIFVAVREFLRSIVERLQGRSLTPQQLNRGRLLGAVAAALTFAAAGVALAYWFWSKFGLQHLEPGHIHPLPLASAALVNAAIVIGLSTAIESLYWLKQEWTLSGPVLDWTPGPAETESSPARIAHLSDLHIVGERYGYRMEKGTRGARGNQCIVHALRKLAALQAQAPLDHILVTGDITDAGTRAEWAEFIDLLRGFPRLQERMSFVPGNHDVNVVDRTNVGRLDLPWSPSQALRKLRTILALDAVQGNRCYTVDHETGALGPLLQQYLRQDNRMQLLRSLAERGSVRGRLELERVWDAIFPLVEPPQTGPRADNRRYGVILLDSNARTHLSLTNAVGFVSPSQLRALKAVLQNSAGSAWIVALHHQVVEYPVAHIRLSDRIGLALVNASDLLSALRPYASQVLILHGHRHRDWIGICDKVVLCSAPSAALGSQFENDAGSFRLHDISFAGHGTLRLVKTEREKIA
ncbi:MAG TPA: metallophosphoesterase [Candidatus Angelobacter sp.]